jgi:hypothetical protein
MQDLERQQVPRITIVLTALSPMVWLWLNFVASEGFLAIGSQVTLSLATTYMFALSCSLYSRWYHPDVLGRKSVGIFQLGQLWGTVVDIAGLCFLAIIWVLAWYALIYVVAQDVLMLTDNRFPYTTPVVPSGINYAPIITAGVTLLGVLYYILYARKHYQNPAPMDSIAADARRWPSHH